MNRRSVALLLLVAVAAFAAVVLFAPKPETPVEPACSDSATCGTVSQATAPGESAVPAPPTKAAVALPKPEQLSTVDAAALRDEADRLIREGNIKEGVASFRKAVEVDPSARNHGDLGALLYKLAAFDEAGVHLRAAAALDPMNADRWIALANLYYRTVDLGEAWKAEAKAREVEPGLRLGRDAEGMRIRQDAPSGAAP